jgi:hypothetical protein
VTIGTGLLTSYLLDRLNTINENNLKKAEDKPKEMILKTLPHLKNLNKIYAPGSPKSYKSKTLKRILFFRI